MGIKRNLVQQPTNSIERMGLQEDDKTYLGTKTMKPFDLIFTILASVSVGLQEDIEISERERE